MTMDPACSSRPPVEGTEAGRGSLADYLGHRFVTTFVSARMKGLAVSVNVNPDKECDFNCVYCEVNRRALSSGSALELEVMERELSNTLELVQSGRIRELPDYRLAPGSLLGFGKVSLSGEGEPTQSTHFLQVMETVIHLRSKGSFPFFKIILLTNASGFQRPEVARGLELLAMEDEVWAKLDAGSQEHMASVNGKECDLERVLENILSLARRRPVVIQSLFPSLKGTGPTTRQIEQYVECLVKLQKSGARIPLVQVYSARKPFSDSECGHLPLKSLSAIAQQVRAVAGIPVEIY